MFFCKESTFTAVKNLSRFIQLPIAACLVSADSYVAREPRGVHSCLILSRNLIGQRENKRFYVTEIVFWLEFADVSFRRRQATAGNTSAFAGYKFLRQVSNRPLNEPKMFLRKKDSKSRTVANSSPAPIRAYGRTCVRQRGSAHSNSGS